MTTPKQNIRKQYIIDKKFQLRTTFTVIGVVTIISAIIIAAIASYVVWNNSRIDNIYQIEDNVFSFLTSRFQGVEDPAYKNAIKQIAQNHNDNLGMLKQIITVNQYLLVALLVYIIGQGLVLYMMLIRQTHRISGPIYVMSNYIRQIIAGNWPTMRNLREKDELKDFYDLLRQMVEHFKKQAGK